MKCCDCGLVHEMQFGTFVEKNRKHKNFEIVDLPLPVRAKFRIRRRDGKQIEQSYSRIKAASPRGRA